MAELGIAPEEALRHAELLRSPPPYTRVLRPCRLGDGIRRIADEEASRLSRLAEDAAQEGRLSKFVPASGAASRMFKSLLDCLAELDEAGHRQNEGLADGAGARPCSASPDALTFFENLERFAFFGELRAELERHGIHGLGDRRAVLAHLLTPRGLDYAELPKGLIPFHRYPDGARTPFEEHLVEAAEICRDSTGLCRLHFTVPVRREAAFRRLLDRVSPSLAERHGARLRVGFSHQRRATDTLAVDPEHLPFRLADGRLLFRPGGHGALLGNLQELADGGEDVVLLKNIDNVVPDRTKPLVSAWKRLLTGLLLDLRRRAHDLLAALAESRPSSSSLDGAISFLERELGRPLPPRLAGAAAAELRRHLLAALDRPMRVCGVVRNLGEPGGGPFWVESPGGEVSLQIVETSQIDPRSSEQQAVLSASTHFNPVDIACAIRDPRGGAYDLDRFVDPATVFVAAKHHEGRPLKALERPGLWNGAMAGWNTVFVEVPDATFAPVKTVLDLLRPEHLI